MFKFIFLSVLSAVIFFFVWNFLRRFFFQEYNQPMRRKEENSSEKSRYKWDAETVDYEEIPEKKESKNN